MINILIANVTEILFPQSIESQILYCLSPCSMQKINYDNDKLFLSINYNKKTGFNLGQHIFSFKSCQTSEQSDNDQINGMVLV